MTDSPRRRRTPRRGSSAGVAATEPERTAAPTAVDDDVTVAEALAAVAEAEAASAAAEAASARARAALIQARARQSSPATDHQSAEPTATYDDDTAEPADVELVSAGEVSEPDEPSGSRRGLPWRPTLAGTAVALGIFAICSTLALTVIMVRDHQRAEADKVRDAQYTAAARRGVEALLSIDYNDARTDVQRVIDASTGAFRDDFAKNADDFIKSAQDSRAVSKGSVVAAAVQERTSESAVVALTATSEVNNSNGARNQPRTWRMNVTVAPDGDQVKISKVDFVP